MGRSQRGAARVYCDHGFTRGRLTAIQNVARENPRVSRRDAVGPFTVNPDGVQILV